jgi:hypothetical protein
MKTTKKEYIAGHPKSRLAKKLSQNNWPDDTEIEIIGGLPAPQTKTSNLYQALQRAAKKEFILGGHRQRGAEGWWIAVA